MGTHLSLSLPPSLRTAEILRNDGKFSREGRYFTNKQISEFVHTDRQTDTLSLKTLCFPTSSVDFVLFGFFILRTFYLKKSSVETWWWWWWWLIHYSSCIRSQCKGRIWQGKVFASILSNLKWTRCVSRDLSWVAPRDMVVDVHMKSL